MILSRDLPAGNIEIIALEPNRATLGVEMRDSGGEWFYWKFKAVFSRPGRYEFCFTGGPKIGTRGPAVSYDCGKSWSWLSEDLHQDTQGFSFECVAPGEVWFCQAIPYLQTEFDAFAGEFRDHPAFQVSTLCRSRKGRNVELVSIREGEPEASILLTSRHHAQEMMATHALEGILRAILADTGFAREFRKHIAVDAVPFVDKDGAEDGDQGKNRRPFDHARDYAGERSIYPETAAIRKLIDEKKPFFLLDMHCPWIRGGTSNEEIYMVGSELPESALEMDRFGRILEQEAPACAPYSRKNNIPFGTSWNTAENFKNGLSLKHYGQRYKACRFTQSLEIPFANIGALTADRSAMLRFGEAIARSILRY